MKKKLLVLPFSGDFMKIKKEGFAVMKNLNRGSTG